MIDMKFLTSMSMLLKGLTPFVTALVSFPFGP